MSARTAQALESMTSRIASTAAEAGTGFPHFADPTTGAWTRTPDGDWTGGFWCGLLWLAAHRTGEPALARHARDWATRLAPRIDSATVFRGFLFWYGVAIADRLGLADEEQRSLALSGARSLARDFNPSAGLIPLGPDAEEAERVGLSEANIDGVPGSVPLLLWAASETEDASLREIALCHAERHIDLCVRRDGSVRQSASFDPTSGTQLRAYTHKGVSDDSTWTRAQAWAMLGFAQATRADPERFMGVAVRVADWWVEHVPADLVAYWDFDDPAVPNAPRDTSGTAIAAASLSRLARLVPERRGLYSSHAADTISALVSRHLTPVTSEDRRPTGMLVDGCYNNRIGLAPANELIWGDYFLYESMCALEGSVQIEDL